MFARGFESRIALAACVLLAAGWPAGPAAAQPVTADAASGGGDAALGKKIAVLSLDALGMDPEPVGRLEALFRNEIERLAGTPLPSRREIQRVLRGDDDLLRCGGKTECLARIGKKLGVELVVFGSVASLGDSFILDIKVVDAGRGEEVRRIQTDPLKGNPDELIEAVRVAAYRLLAPERLQGSIMVLADIKGARVQLDGKPVGRTPLSQPIRGLSLGKHRLAVTAPDYSPFDEEVIVRFQKTSRVVVQLTDDPTAGIKLPQKPLPPRDPKPRWYQNKWVWLGAGVAAVVIGGFAGYALTHDSVIDCESSPEGCR